MALDYKRILFGPTVREARRRRLAGGAPALLIAMAMVMLIVLAAVPLLMNDRVADNLGTALRYGAGADR